jgi:hypothetical protein
MPSGMHFQSKKNTKMASSKFPLLNQNVFQEQTYEATFICF